MKRGYQLTCLRRSVVKKKRKIKNIILVSIFFQKFLNLQLLIA